MIMTEDLIKELSCGEVDGGPRALRAIPLEVAFYLGGPRHSDFEEYAWFIFRSAPAWKVRAFLEFEHMSEFLENWVPDVVLTHWHGDGSNEEAPMKLANVLRYEKIAPTFLVGQYSSWDARFGGGVFNHVPSYQDRLLGSFDMIFEKPMDYRFVPYNIAAGLWSAMNLGKSARYSIPVDLGSPFELYSYRNRVELRWQKNADSRNSTGESNKAEAPDTPNPE